MVLLHLLFNLGCARVQITDSIWYADKGSLGALQLHTLTSEQAEVPKPNWDVRRYGMLCTDVNTFAAWKADIEQLCSISANCDYPSLQLFFKRIQKLELP